jgi:hypothetical protein
MKIGQRFLKLPNIGLTYGLYLLPSPTYKFAAMSSPTKSSEANFIVGSHFFIKEFDKSSHGDSIISFSGSLFCLSLINCRYENAIPPPAESPIRIHFFVPIE